MTREEIADEQLPDFADPAVQIVYNLLCDGLMPPNKEEHWEGWIARRILAALRAEQPLFGERQ